MKKIKNAIIHLLGGFTEDEAELIIKNVRCNAFYCILWKMEDCYGLSAFDWCNNMYRYVKDKCEKYKK
jgi:hypothetical protein